MLYMIIYLSKLILILVFNTYVNIHYMYSECKCCCGDSKSGEMGSGSNGNLSINPTLGHNPPKGPNPIGIPSFGANPPVTVHTPVKPQIKDFLKIEININDDSIKITNVKKDTKNFTKIDEKTNTTNDIVHKAYSDLTNFYKFDGEIFNCITKDSEITITGVEFPSYILFAVLTEGNEYYLRLCTDGSLKIDDGFHRGIFEEIDGNYDIKILGIGGKLNSFYSMFYDCNNLKNVTFVKSVDTKNIIEMCSMFYGCSSLEELNLSNFNTENVTNMSDMFNGCSSLKELNLSNFNTNKVTNMSSMFFGCSSLANVNLSNFSTQNVINMSCMFFGCSLLANLDLSKFSTQNETNMDGMFDGCKNLEGNVTTKDEKIINDYYQFIKEISK